MFEGYDLDYLNAVPEAGFGAYAGNFGGFNPFTRWLFNQMPRFGTQYAGALGRNPSLKWTDYLGGMDPKTEWSNMGPESRGEQPRSWFGRTRWSWS